MRSDVVTGERSLMLKHAELDRDFLVTIRRAMLMIAKSDKSDDAIRQAVLKVVDVIEARLTV